MAVQAIPLIQTGSSSDVVGLTNALINQINNNLNQAVGQALAQTVGEIGGNSLPNLNGGTVNNVPLTFGILSDSLGAQSNYMPYGAGLYAQYYGYNPTRPSPVAPSWLANTAYVQGNAVKNGGSIYYCATAGTSGNAGGPTGQGGGITDGTAVWNIVQPNVAKGGSSILAWMEWLLGGVARFDMSQGYSGTTNGMIGAIVVSGGQNYTNPTITLNFGAQATVQVGGGQITGITVTNPGYTQNGAFTYTLNDPTGSGAVLSLIFCGSGTHGIVGCLSSDGVARLPDVAASTLDAVFVQLGTNDGAAGGIPSAVTITNLRTIYDTLCAAGKKVIAMPIPPRAAGITLVPKAFYQAVNNFIYAYAKGDITANPNRNHIYLADPTRYTTDMNNTAAVPYPIGGVASGAGPVGAMTLDGIHPSPRGAFYNGKVMVDAVTPIIAGAPRVAPARIYSQSNGADPVLNPNGNLIEALPWTPNEVLTKLGQNRTNGGNVYTLTVLGTTAPSGGPTGTGGGIVDGTAQWNYCYPAGISVANSGSQAAPTLAGLTTSGNLPAGLTLSHSGSSSGTVVCGIETPWSDGQIGKRATFTFSLGSGTVSDQFALQLGYRPLLYYGLQGDVGATPIMFEWDVELSGLANMNQLAAYFYSDFSYGFAGVYNQSAVTNLPNSANEPLVLPNNGRLLLRTQPFVLPPQTTVINPQLLIGFNASGGAGSATGVVKVNHIEARRALFI